MGKIYVGQTKLKIIRIAGVDITGGVAVIKYIKPSGKTGVWSDVSVLDYSNGTIQYQIPLSVSTDVLNERGIWITWAYVTFSDTKVAAGEPVKMMVYDEGT